MPTQDLIHYRDTEASTNYPVMRGGGGSSDNSSLFLTSSNEDWITKKRVETKTTKNVEKRIQRQVVLEDGRIIEEDEPEITVDTIEDTQSHSEDGDEDRRHFYDDNWPTAIHTGGDVLSETNRRNVYTKNIREQTVTTASAKNLGDISAKDIEKVIRHGKRTRQFIRAHDDDSSSTDPISIPAKVIHTGKSNKVLVDREDIREIDRMDAASGKVKTERFVTREMVEDDGQETPEEGDSTETESRDGDRDAFAQRKEDRFVDYYRVPRGKSLQEGKFLGHGIHLTSHDKSDQRGNGVSALAYHRDDRSDSSPGSSGGWPSRPPRSSDNQQRRRRSTSATGKRANQRLVAAAPSTPRDTPERYSTMDRTSWRPSSSSLASRDHHGINGSSTASLSRPRGESSSTLVRSRSVSRSPMPPQQQQQHHGSVDRRQHVTRHRINNDSSASHHRSMTTLRPDLDEERSGRLKRAMSFSTKSVGPIGAGEKGSIRGGSSSRPTTPSKPHSDKNVGILGSVKSLYATIRRKSGKEYSSPKPNYVQDQPHFDNGVEPPRRPPRKNQSSSSVISGNSGGQFSSLDRRGYRSSSNIHSNMSASQNDLLGQKWSVYPPPQQQQQHHTSLRHAPQPSPRRDATSTGTLRRDTTSSTMTSSRYRDASAMTSSSTLPRSHHQNGSSSFVLSPGSVGSGAGGGRHRSTSRSGYDEVDNREPPRFEPARHRDRSSRFFGSYDDDQAGVEHGDRPRPPPDMRRLLLSNVNASRSTSKNLDSTARTIRAS